MISASFHLVTEKTIVNLSGGLTAKGEGLFLAINLSIMQKQLFIIVTNFFFTVKEKIMVTEQY